MLVASSPNRRGTSHVLLHRDRSVNVLSRIYILGRSSLVLCRVESNLPGGWLFVLPCHFFGNLGVDDRGVKSNLEVSFLSLLIWSCEPSGALGDSKDHSVDTPGGKKADFASFLCARWNEDPNDRASRWRDFSGGVRITALYLVGVKRHASFLGTAWPRRRHPGSPCHRTQPHVSQSKGRHVSVMVDNYQYYEC